MKNAAKPGKVATLFRSMQQMPLYANMPRFDGENKLSNQTELERRARQLGIDLNELPDREPPSEFVSLGDAAARVVQKLAKGRADDSAL